MQLVTRLELKGEYARLVVPPPGQHPWLLPFCPHAKAGGPQQPKPKLAAAGSTGVTGSRVPMAEPAEAPTLGNPCRGCSVGPAALEAICGVDDSTRLNGTGTMVHVCGTEHRQEVMVLLTSSNRVFTPPVGQQPAVDPF